ncbi:hypothetical protein [Microcoleus vaginatus]|uniref:hypothetical protein n=1 Tax=Microcoleus vaginatus TaxID=119532 RepID=UPI001F616B99|nr:hypothetical protein D0A37_08425 [Microcoleus vaginatus HSN003]
MYALAQNFLAQILDAASAEILSLRHLFFRGISPKIGISIYCSLCVAIAQNRCFLAAAPVRVREEKQPIALRRDRSEEIAKSSYFLAQPQVLFETKNNLNGEDLRYDCYYY